MVARILPRTSGFTLVELTFAVAIMTVLMGVLFTLSLGIGDTAANQELKNVNNDEARKAMLAIAPRLRQAVRESINFKQLPSDVLIFRMPRDLDGNGLAVDAFNSLELGPSIEIRRDRFDQNKDGIGLTQLIMISGDSIRVLANNVFPDRPPVPDKAGKIPTRITTGFWVQEEDGNLRVTIRTRGISRRGHVLRHELSQVIAPRN